MKYFFIVSEPITAASLVEDPDGGVLLIGGFTEKDIKVHDTIYKLSSLEDDWKELPKKLKTPRFGHTAFFVPDNVVNCN